MIPLEENKSIEKLTTMGVKGTTFQYCEIKETSHLIELLKSNSLPIRILGGGSNILWTKNFEGLTVQINTKGISIEKESDSFVIVDINAGENWNEFVTWAINNNYGGVENLALIPAVINILGNASATLLITLITTFNTLATINNTFIRVFKNWSIAKIKSTRLITNLTKFLIAFTIFANAS